MTASVPQQGHVDAGAGVQLFHRVDGSASPAVVVLHGGPGLTHDYLADDLLPLADTHRVIHDDQRGSGRSSLVSDADALDARRFADDLEAVRLHSGLERLTLLRHSWGAAVAALYAMCHPQRVERLVLVGAMALRRDELARSFVRIRESGDAAWRSQLQARGQALVADPGDADACRAFYDTYFTPIFLAMPRHAPAAVATSAPGRRSRGATRPPMSTAAPWPRWARTTGAANWAASWRPRWSCMAAPTWCPPTTRASGPLRCRTHAWNCSTASATSRMWKRRSGSFRW